MSVSKAQQFALAAEAVGDWEVTRAKKKDGRRVVTATRGEESFEFAWSPNPGGRTSLKFDSGAHTVGGHTEEFTNVKGALRLMLDPPGTRRAVKLAPRRAGTEDGADKVQLVRLPFDPEASTDTEVMAALAGHRVTWFNAFSGQTENGVCPKGGIHFTLDTVGAKRVLTFCDQSHTRYKDGTSGFRSVDISQIVEVKR